MKRKQRREKKKTKIKKYIRNIILILLISLIIYIMHGLYQENKIRLLEGEYIVESLQTNNIVEETKVIEKVEYNIPKTYLGYKVSAVIEIPKIDLKLNVLEKYSEEGLDIALSKYWGPSPNEIGNYCIAGHNEKNMFNHLIDLEIGDKIYLIDGKNGKYKYNIYDIYRVKPYNTKPLSQDTNKKRELTLITCVNYSRNRLIVKAVEE